MKLYIRNMVCNRCVMAVKAELVKAGLHPLSIILGEAEITEKKLTAAQHKNLDEGLVNIGFELIDDKKSRIIEKIKNLIIDLVHHSGEDMPYKHSEYITQHLHHEYTYLSKLFSEVEGVTIEQYIIRQKIERVKELLVYDELSLTEIAYKMGYSSVAHLSAQFKKVTGLTPGFYKNKGMHHRLPLDKLGKR